MGNANNQEIITHYLVNFTGRGEPVEAKAIALHLGKAMAAAGVDLLMASTHISQIGVDPYRIGLADVWNKICANPIDRQQIAAQFPELVLVLDLLSMRGVTPV